MFLELNKLNKRSKPKGYISPKSALMWSACHVALPSDLQSNLLYFRWSRVAVASGFEMRQVRLACIPGCLALSLTNGVYYSHTQQARKQPQRLSLARSVCLNQYSTIRIPPAYGKYELHGMVVHCGQSLDTGHYYCFQLVQRRWSLFNDARVTPATWSDLESVARGDSATHCPTVLFYQRADYARAGNEAVSSPQRGRVSPGEHDGGSGMM